MSRDEPAVSYEDWDKEEKKKEEQEEQKQKKLRQEEQEKRRKERERRRREEEKKKKEEEIDSDDEEILKDVRGYKTMSNGRKTSYFTREINSHEKNLIGDITPKIITDSNHESPSSLSTPTENHLQISPREVKRASSAWNSAGTWEEKDTTDWCQKKFKARLMETASVHGDYAAISTEVDKVTGDASVALVSGKKRYIFDFSTKVTFQISDDSDENLAKGEVKLIDIHSAAASSDDDYDFELKWVKQAPKGKQSPVNVCKNNFLESLRRSINSFVEDFNSEY